MSTRLKPAAFYWQDNLLNGQKHGPYFGWPGAKEIARTEFVAIPIPLYAFPEGSVVVPRELVERILSALSDTPYERTEDELRAILDEAKGIKA